MLNRISIEKLREKTGNIYRLVNLAAKRARELNEAAPKLVDIESKSTILIALAEIAEGKVRCKEENATRKNT